MKEPSIENKKRGELPLISFCVFSYNQEDIILEAIESAFNQTYENIEFIFSDDNSSDKTFRVIDEYVKSMKNKRIVKLIKNINNLGISKHLDNVVRNHCKGKLIIVQAGDDVSFKERTDDIVTMWKKSNQEIYCISSRFIEMEYNSTIIRQIHNTNNDENIDKISNREFIKYYKGDIGATFAFRPEVITSFNPMQSKHYEDKCIAFRSKLLGGYVTINKVLLYHRKEGISNFKTTREYEDNVLKVRPIILEQMLIDIQEPILKIKYSIKELNFYKKIINKHLNFYLLMHKFIDANSINKLLFLVKLILNGDFYRVRIWRNRIFNELF
jgi:glycosyltransferase involved in cell wall biosynthesis